MIKETDLRIGNIIYYQSSEDGLLPNIVDWDDLKWLSENPASFNETFKPIPISWVTLLKLGWEINHDGGVFHILSKNVGEWGLFLISSDGCGLHYEHRNASFSTDIHYYHQLENLFYFTTGQYLGDDVEELEVSKLSEEMLADDGNGKDLPF
jgi:hypothetical protein